MGIQNKDLGRYKRPGIFINEIDNSIIELPIQNVLINIVPGFSKKGPVNNPIYITNRNDFIKIFGNIDRGLERKGSYFHRTCLKMINSGPIWALNLLDTDDTRDTVNWKSISCGAAYTNASQKSMPYSRLFNRQDFWERDDESLLDYVNSVNTTQDNLLHITNIGEKTITVFTYKSSVSGFDVTLETWYGGTTNVPSYLNPKDWVSDYMVSVLVIEGDWTNYDNLAADSTWGNYFTTSGLDKTLVQNFVNEQNVTTLGYYETSLIPYFKDVSGRDMYIKSIINNNTDTTGLFCAYDEDTLLDSDHPTGKMDLIGDGIVGEETSSINFLSYDENILESKVYVNTPLDSVGNVFGNYSSLLSGNFATKDSRTATKTNWYVENVQFVLGGLNFDDNGNNGEPTTSGNTLYKVDNGVISDGKTWFQIDGTPNVQHTPYSEFHKPLSKNEIVYLSKDFGPFLANTAYYIADVTQSQAMFTLTDEVGGNAISFNNYEDLNDATNLYVQRINVGFSLTPNSHFNLSNNTYTIDSGLTNTNIVLEPLEFADADLSDGYSYNRYDVLYLTAGDDAEVQILKGTQSEGNAIRPDFNTSYENAIILGYVHLSITSGVTAGTGQTNYAITTDYTPITLDTSGYLRAENITISGHTSNSVNYLTFSFGDTSGTNDNSNYNKLRYRAIYSEMESALDDGKGVIINHTNGYKKHITNATFIDYSTTYDASITFSIGNVNWSDYCDTETYNWLVYYLDNEFYIADGISETGIDRLMTTLAPAEDLVGSGNTYNAGVIGKYSNIYIDNYNGVINNGDFGYVNNLNDGTQIYIKAWIEGTDALFIDFMSDTTDGASPEPIMGWVENYSDINDTQNFIIWSNMSNYKQTLEIEYVDPVKVANNLVYEIKVDKNRYSEVRNGDLLEAYYDESLYAADGELYGYDPRKLTRVVNTTIDSTNSNWKILTTDAPIKITEYTQSDLTSSDYHTTIYPQIDTYVNTYKGIALTPFVIHPDSIPNGTETRQSSILDVMGKTTNLTKGLINKNKISWRYLIDSFGNGLSERSKQQYADICSLKLNCLAFINAPSVKELKASASPSFTNDDRTLNTSFLKDGGDESKNPAFLYSFADGPGKSCVGYFFPYLTVNDAGIPKNVPPAAYVASTYMNKHIAATSSIQPWTISAGITNGRVANITGVEMDFTDSDLENLYGMGLNPIVKKRNAGYCINSESTAQVYPMSSLSFLHSRELLIELENSLYDMLLRYQWRFNTAEIRAEIKFRADKICQDLQERNGLYNYKNVIDETNNTNYIIDLQMGVLDTYIEVIKGMAIIVNNITILKKGDIESGGFM